MHNDTMQLAEPGQRRAGRRSGGGWLWYGCLGITVILCSTVPSLGAAAGPPVYPLTVSANGRYLVDQDNTPFMIVGDSPQGLITDLTLAEADAFFANRASYGFNAMWVHLLSGSTFGGGANGATYDGITPFTTAGDISTPRESYFARVDAMLTLAANHGIAVFLTAAETIDWLSFFKYNGEAKCRAFGQYVGNRYRNHTNIVWMYGNDFQTWRTPADNAVILAVANGVKDTDPNHLHTVMLDYFVSASRDSTDWAAMVEADLVYTYYSTYAKVLAEYARTPVMPVFMGEANYEFEQISVPLTTARILRRQEYWSLLSGATGQFYGNGYTWHFLAGWQAHLDTPGAIQMSHLKALFANRAWHELIPDPSHAVVTSGYGTFAEFGSVDTNDYATAARTPDGTLVMAYMPTARTLTVDLSTLSGSATARWYDPSNGLYTVIHGPSSGLFPSVGTQAFTPPGPNGDGDGDWVLVLETGPTVSRVSPASGPSAGGTVVTLTGTSFAPGATVSFGGNAATKVTVENSTLITATTPAHAAGAVIAVVTNPNSLSGSLLNGFTYADATVAGDFTRDGKSDILWRHATLGEVWLWPISGAARAGEVPVRTVGDTDWEIRGVGDQNGDGQADVLWRHRSTGWIYFWPMSGKTPLSETYVATVDPAYDIVGTGDYNGDGRSDILWRHLTNGEVWVWLMDGPAPLSQRCVDTVDPAYAVAGSGDLNGDTKADIVFRHSAYGEVWVWLMDGATRTSQTLVATVGDVGYRIVGVADHTGDGKADILWHHATRGEVWIWPMDGTTVLGQSYVDAVPDAGYQIVGSGDYDGDGKADILWQHRTRGEVWVWLMNGATKLSETWVATVPEPGYQVVKVK